MYSRIEQPVQLLMLEAIPPADIGELAEVRGLAFRALEYVVAAFILRLSDARRKPASDNGNVSSLTRRPALERVTARIPKRGSWLHRRPSGPTRKTIFGQACPSHARRVTLGPSASRQYSCNGENSGKSLKPNYKTVFCLPTLCAIGTQS